jgi:hypothetical protein
MMKYFNAGSDEQLNIIFMLSDFRKPFSRMCGHTLLNSTWVHMYEEILPPTVLAQFTNVRIMPEVFRSTLNVVRANPIMQFKVLNDLRLVMQVVEQLPECAFSQNPTLGEMSTHYNSGNDYPSVFNKPDHTVYLVKDTAVHQVVVWEYTMPKIDYTIAPPIPRPIYQRPQPIPSSQFIPPPIQRPSQFIQPIPPPIQRPQPYIPPSQFIPQRPSQITPPIQQPSQIMQAPSQTTDQQPTQFIDDQTVTFRPRYNPETGMMDPMWDAISYETGKPVYPEIYKNDHK